MEPQKHYFKVGNVIPMSFRKLTLSSKYSVRAGIRPATSNTQPRGTLSLKKLRRVVVETEQLWGGAGGGGLTLLGSKGLSLKCIIGPG